MIIISDYSPLISLALIQKLGILEKLSLSCSHALRGNTRLDALRPDSSDYGTRSVSALFPRKAWEQEKFPYDFNKSKQEVYYAEIA